MPSPGQQVARSIELGIDRAFGALAPAAEELARQATPSVTGRLRDSAVAARGVDRIVLLYTADYGAAFESRSRVLESLAPQAENVLAREFDRTLNREFSRG